MLRLFASVAFIATLAACASSQPAPNLPSGASSGLQRVSPASGSCCDIFWNKKRLNLRYGSKPTMDAVLRYWAPNGYYLTQIYCQNGSQITATPGRTWGDPSGYKRVKYSFTTHSSGPDRCGVTAVLNDTGSPPVAVLKIRIE